MKNRMTMLMLFAAVVLCVSLMRYLGSALLCLLLHAARSASP